MTNTTSTYWSADGVSLQTFAQNIETLGGGRDAPPKFRGDDDTIPYRIGQQWRAKTPDSRILPLAMWVRGVNEDGSIPTSRSDAYDDNWRELKNLLWQVGRQFLLQKRFKVGGELRSATALAEYSDGLAPTMIGRSAGKFTVDLKLADPYFYDDHVTQVTLADGDNIVTLPSDTISTRVKLIINDARSNVLVINKTLGMQVEYHDATVLGDMVEIDAANYTSTTTPSGSASYDSEASIRHAGSDIWLALKGGDNVINLSSDSGTGLVFLQARGAWL